MWSAGQKTWVQEILPGDEIRKVRLYINWSGEGLWCEVDIEAELEMVRWASWNMQKLPPEESRSGQLFLASRGLSRGSNADGGPACSGSSSCLGVVTDVASVVCYSRD